MATAKKGPPKEAAATPARKAAAKKAVLAKKATPAKKAAAPKAAAAKPAAVAKPRTSIWQSFYTFTNMSMLDSWTEILQVHSLRDGTYDLRIYNPPVEPDDEPDWIEWQAVEPVPASALLNMLVEGIESRGLRKEVALEAALSLCDAVASSDAAAVQKAIVSCLADQPALLAWLHENRSQSAKALERLRRKA